jgi:3',5'-cyclic AMP phosphodiesterase CpdA
MKLIHLTDPHLVQPGMRLYGLDPRERLDLAVASINRLHADADLVVITGDLAHAGESEAYVELRGCLDALRVPYVPMLGNHDDRRLFLELFPDAPQDLHGFIQGVREVSAGRLLFLDTNQPYTHQGWYCEQRMAWLAERLAEGGDTPVFLFMHHPPFEVGLGALDRIGLVQRAPFAATLAPHMHKVRHLFFGHVHRPISGSWLGVPFSTLRATSHQVWLDFGAEAELPGSHEPPAYAVVFIDDERVIVHNHDFLDSSRKFSLGEQSEADREVAAAIQA